MADRLIEQARRILNPGGLSPEPMERLRTTLVRPQGQAPSGHRGGRQQRAFLEAIADKRFLPYLREQGVEPDFEQGADSVLAATLPKQLEEEAFLWPPASVAREMHNCYRGLTPTAVANVTVWNVITLRNIDALRIEESFLAAGGRGRVSGRRRIQLALQEHRLAEAMEAAPESKPIDDCVRNVFRAMGGLHHVRGHRSVISDCVLARHWWVGHFVEQAAAACSDLDEGRAWEALNRHWPTLSEYAMRRLTILASPALMSGLIAHLAEHSVTHRELETFLRRVGMAFSAADMHAWRADAVRERLWELSR